MKKGCFCLFFISLLCFQPLLGESAESMIRTTGDTTGISFAEETKGAKPINGNVRGVSFSQWMTGRKTNLYRQTRVSSLKTKPTYPSSYYHDTTRVLSTKNREALKRILAADKDVLIAD